MTRESTENDRQDREVLARILAEHQAVATGLGEWACKCSPMEWRPSAYRSRHMAEALILSGRVQVIPPEEQAHEHDAAGCLDCDCWSGPPNSLPCTCPAIPPGGESDD